MDHSWRLLERGELLKKLFLLMTILAISTCLFPITEEELTTLLLEEDYHLKLEHFLTDSPTTRAAIAIVNGLRYIETVRPYYRIRFIDSYEHVEREELSEVLSIALEIVRVNVLESTIKGLRLLAEQDPVDLLEVISLRVHFANWLTTGAPEHARTALEKAESLRTRYPTSFFPYKVILVYHSTSAFGVREEFLRMRELALENLEGDSILAVIVEGLYRLGEFDMVIDDFSRMQSPEHQSTFYAGVSSFKTGDHDSAEKLLASIDDLRAISPRDLTLLFFVRGQIAEDKGDISGAIEMYSKSVQHDSNNRQALKRLALAYLKSDEPNRETLARFYLERSNLEDFDPEVAQVLRELRIRVVGRVLVTQILPLAAAVVITLIVVEYFHKRRKRLEEKKALEENGDGHAEAR